MRKKSPSVAFRYLHCLPYTFLVEGRSAGVDAVGYGRKKIMVPLGAVGSLWVPLGAERSRYQFAS